MQTYSENATIDITAENRQVIMRKRRFDFSVPPPIPEIIFRCIQQEVLPSMAGI